MINKINTTSFTDTIPFFISTSKGENKIKKNNDKQKR